MLSDDGEMLITCINLDLFFFRRENLLVKTYTPLTPLTPTIPTGMSDISGSVSRANTVEMFSAKDSNLSDLPYNDAYRNYVCFIL